MEEDEGLVGNGQFAGRLSEYLEPIPPELRVEVDLTVEVTVPMVKVERLWTPEAEGPGHLRTLQEAGVGALALAAADTPFSLRTADNRTLGAVRATSVYLREDGGVGSTQQIDLVA